MNALAINYRIVPGHRRCFVSYSIGQTLMLMACGAGAGAADRIGGREAMAPCGW